MQVGNPKQTKKRYVVSFDVKPRVNTYYADKRTPISNAPSELAMIVFRGGAFGVPGTSKSILSTASESRLTE